MSALAALTSLTTLWLSDNLITTGVAELVTLINATDILLGNNNVTIPCADLATLQTALPGVVTPSTAVSGTDCT